MLKQARFAFVTFLFVPLSVTQGVHCPLLAKGPQVPPQPGVTSAPKLLAPLPLVGSHSPSLARDAISGGRGQRAPSLLACDD